MSLTDRHHVFSSSVSCSLLTLGWQRNIETTGHDSTSPTEKTRTWLAQHAMPPSMHTWALNRGLCTHLINLFWFHLMKATFKVNDWFPEIEPILKMTQSWFSWEWFSSCSHSNSNEGNVLMSERQWCPSCIQLTLLLSTVAVMTWSH